MEDKELWVLYKKQVASYWTTEEIDLAQDLTDWTKLNDDEKHFIKYVLAFFAASDGIVIENLIGQFVNEVKQPEAKAFYAFQAAMENIHSETYSMLIEELISDDKEKANLFNAVKEIPVIKEKADWVLKWMNNNSDNNNDNDNNNTFEERLVAFAAVEGILFSGSFCSIFWLKKRGLMPGLSFSNEMISRDEGLHTEFACALYNKSSDENKLSEYRVHEIIRGAVEVERKFICEAIPCNLIGMNSRMMYQYIQFVADRLATMLGCSKLYHVTNPFPFMELISLQAKTNFFERRIGDYQKASVVDSSAESNQFVLDDDF